MKKLIAVFVVTCILLLWCMPAFAGDIPEAFSYENEAKVCIGTLVDFKESSAKNRSDVKEVTLLPVLKIKGEVEVGVEQTYPSCYFPKATPEQGAEYFFGWLPGNAVYAYKVTSRTEDKITLQITDEFSERIQNYLDEGLYEQEEIARVNIGRKITLSEYLGTDRSFVEKVTFSLNDVEYDINADAFFKFSDNALITDVKNRILKRMGAEDWAEDILYIRLTLKDGRNGGGFASVTRFCEVDRYHPMMGRLPNCDFTMTWEDLAKLYSFLPRDVQRELYAKNGAETDSSIVAMVVGGVACFGIGCAVGVIAYCKKRK